MSVQLSGKSLLEGDGFVVTPQSIIVTCPNACRAFCNGGACGMSTITEAFKKQTGVFISGSSTTDE